MKKNKCLFPGTFDPFTNGHLEVLKQAQQDFDQVHIVIMENEEKTTYFNLKTRLAIIKELNYQNIVIDYWAGLATDYCLNNSISTIVRGYRNQKDLAYEKRIAKVYKQFWNKIKIKLYKSPNSISSSEVKKLILENKNFQHLVPWKENIWTKED